MAEKDTAGFLKWMNAMNDSIADPKAAEAKIKSQVGLDPVREERDSERRERLGQLRARPKNRSKTNRIRNAFGYTDPS